MTTNPEPDVPVSGKPSSLDRIELIEYAMARALALDHVIEQRPVPLPTDLPRRPAAAARDRIP